MVSRAGVTPGQVEDLVRAAERAAEESGPAEDAAPLIDAAQAGTGDTWDDPPAETSIGVFEAFAPALGEAFGRRAGRLASAVRLRRSTS